MTIIINKIGKRQIFLFLTMPTTRMIETDNAFPTRAIIKPNIAQAPNTQKLFMMMTKITCLSIKYLNTFQSGKSLHFV